MLRDLRPVVAGRPAPLSAEDLSCVPYARIASGINLVGNAADWWDKAAGIYARGSRPMPGAVLAFRAALQMPLGHVAVVSRLVNPRLITIDHANWGSARNSIVRAVPVLDVSPNNDWTQVRLQTSATGEFGGVYYTFGFIFRGPAPPEVFAGR